MALETTYRPAIASIDDRVAETQLASGPGSAVAWGAIVAGAAAAAALSLILLVLGTGLGLTAISPWSHSGVAASTFGVSTIVWITVTQLMASGMGGYLAGRLRTKWVGVHTDEAYFRDTAHGFLAWAVASLATAAMLTSVVGSIASGAGAAGASLATAAATTVGTAAPSAMQLVSQAGPSAGAQQGSSNGASARGATGYFIDSLFRKSANAGTANAAPTNSASNPSTGNANSSSTPSDSSANASSEEVTRIFVNGMGARSLPPADVTYVGGLVAQRTGLSQQDAEKRVTDTFAAMQAKVRDVEAAAKDAAEKARKATAYATLWIFVSLLAGAFVASLSATFGGRERDAAFLPHQRA
jgi:hypothetical protein